MLWWHYAYDALMGFGYRPFRVFGWAAGLILCFSLIYLLVLPNRINRTQWTLGLLVYLAFLTLSQSGSIFQQLKTLFIG